MLKVNKAAAEVKDTLKEVLREIVRELTKEKPKEPPLDLTPILSKLSEVVKKIGEIKLNTPTIKSNTIDNTEDFKNINYRLLEIHGILASFVKTQSNFNESIKNIQSDNRTFLAANTRQQTQNVDSNEEEILTNIQENINNTNKILKENKPKTNYEFNILRNNEGIYKVIVTSK